MRDSNRGDRACPWGAPALIRVTQSESQEDSRLWSEEVVGVSGLQDEHSRELIRSAEGQWRQVWRLGYQKWPMCSGQEKRVAFWNQTDLGRHTGSIPYQLWDVEKVI